MGRFWVMGPVETSPGAFSWGVVDGRDLPGQRPSRKPSGYREFWPTETEAERHAADLNKENAL